MLGKRSPKSDIIARAVLEGKSYSDIVEMEPGYAMMHKREIDAFIRHYASTTSMEVELLDLGGISRDALPFTCLEVLDWLVDNCGKRYPFPHDSEAPRPHKDRPFKQEQLYLWSTGPNVGKTTLCEELARSFPTSVMCLTENFDSGYDNDCELVVFDEFRAQRTIGYMNSFLQGSSESFPFHMSIKGGTIRKTHNPPVIITSNTNAKYVYPVASDVKIAPFLARLKVIEIPETTSLWPLIEAIRENKQLMYDTIIAPSLDTQQQAPQNVSAPSTPRRPEAAIVPTIVLCPDSPDQYKDFGVKEADRSTDKGEMSLTELWASDGSADDCQDLFTSHQPEVVDYSSDPTTEDEKESEAANSAWYDKVNAMTDLEIQTVYPPVVSSTTSNDRASNVRAHLQALREKHAQSLLELNSRGIPIVTGNDPEFSSNRHIAFPEGIRVISKPPAKRQKKLVPTQKYGLSSKK